MKKPGHAQYERKAAFVFGVFFVVIFLVLALLLPRPTPFQYTVFRIILALAAAGVAVFFPGVLEVEIKSWLRAGGAVAVFVIVYFFSPAGLVTEAGKRDAAGDSTIKPPASGTQAIDPGRSDLASPAPPVVPASGSNTSPLGTIPRDAGQPQERLAVLKTRAAAMIERWKPIQERLARDDQPLQPEIDDALRMLKSHVRLAEGDLRRGDLAAARRAMDLAEKELEFLNRQNPE